jgi:hypothetical protein
MVNPSSAPGPSRPSTISFARLISTCISARLLVDIGVQMFNPFLPIIATGLNTNVVVMGRLIGLRTGVGMFAPLFGLLASRVGYQPVLRGALLVLYPRSKPTSASIYPTPNSHAAWACWNIHGRSRELLAFPQWVC